MEGCFLARATIKDVAASLGVSLSTVNKALYGKPGVSESRRAQILDRARELGYTPNRAALSLAHARIRIGVVLPTGWTSYFEPVLHGIERAFRELRDFSVTGDIRHYDPEDNAPARVRELFLELRSSCDALIFCPSEQHSYREALIAVREFPVAVVGDARPDAPCLFSVETAAEDCAALAANFFELTAPPDALLAVTAGFPALAPHAAKVDTFERCLGRPVLRLFTGDDDDAAYARMRACLQTHPELRGIYIATSAGEGVCRAVRESGLSLRIAATDLTPALREYLREGVIQAIIYQNTYLQGALAVFTLADYLTLRTAPPPVRRVQPRLFLRENCPESFASAGDDLVLRG